MTEAKYYTLFKDPHRDAVIIARRNKLQETQTYICDCDECDGDEIQRQFAVEKHPLPEPMDGGQYEMWMRRNPDEVVENGRRLKEELGYT